MTRRNLWGNTSFNQATYYAFHDESIPSKRWFLIGILLVREDDVSHVLTALRRARSAENYFGEIHFSELPKSFYGQWGAKARVARHWLQAYADGLCDKVFFSALAVDRHSPAFEHKRFAKDFHAYNRFTVIALKAAIAWHLCPLGWDKVKLLIVSDAKDRMSRLDQYAVDNFESYVPNRIQSDFFRGQLMGKKYPLVYPTLELRDSSNDDLLQLCDVLLGAVQEALVARSTRETKRALGKLVVKWCQDIQNPQRERKYNLYRKFNVWAFPNERGEPYNNVPLALEFDDTGPRLPLGY